MSFELSELDRRLANIVRLGAITELDETNALVRVEVGDAETDWLPWITHRAGPNRTWHAPEVGEQVVVLSPSGDLAQGVVLPALYQDDFLPPENEKEKHRVQYADGTVVEYDRAAHLLTVNVAAGGNVLVICNQATVQAADQVTLDTPDVVCTGNMTVTKALNVLGTGVGGDVSTINGSLKVNSGDIVADTISLKHHNHNETGTTTGEAIP